MEGIEEASAGEYEMQHKRRGLALIFNQEKFSGGKQKERQGTAADRAKLTERFQELGFKVKVYDDLPKKRMLQKLKKAARTDHTDADCFMCVFLSHGGDGHIYTYDHEVDIKELTGLFRGENCRGLGGKPKIFIFQACRGELHERGVSPVTPMAEGDSEPSGDLVEEAAMVCPFPAGEDFLTCFSVSEGFVSFRDPQSGSCYIQDLCEVLQQQGSDLEFTQLLTRVNLKVSRRCMNRRMEKQMPCFVSMLTKRLFFRPKQDSTKTRVSIFFLSCLAPKREMLFSQ